MNTSICASRRGCTIGTLLREGAFDFAGRPGELSTGGFSLDGSTIAFASEGRISQWSLNDGHYIGKLSPGGITSSFVSPDGKIIAKDLRGENIKATVERSLSKTESSKPR